MNSDFRVAVDFFSHHKARKLKKRLSSDGLISLLQLWAYAAKLRTDGELSGMDAEDIEIAACWDGEDGVFVAALVEVGFLDQRGDAYALHDWVDNNSWAADAADRQDKARFSRLATVNRAAFDKLKADGVNAISKEDYERLTTVRRPSDERRTNAGDPPTPAPSPAPSPAQKAYNPIGSLENEEPARVEDNADANTCCADEPSIDFLELRQFWNEHFRAEGPLAGFAEYKQLRAARAYPGDSRIYADLQARIDGQFWNQGFAISLARYLRERTWETPPKARAAPTATDDTWEAARARVEAQQALINGTARGVRA